MEIFLASCSFVILPFNSINNLSISWLVSVHPDTRYLSSNSASEAWNSSSLLETLLEAQRLQVFEWSACILHFLYRMAFPYELCLEASIAPLGEWPSLSGIQVLNAQMIIPSRMVDQNARPTFCFSLGRVWYSFMPKLSRSPRLLSTEQENSLVNCLHHFGSNIFKSPSHQPNWNVNSKKL